MSPDEIESRYSTLQSLHNEHLLRYGVRIPTKGSNKALHLIFLHKYMGTLVHKDTISAFVRTVNPNAGADQQVRHIAADGWNVLNSRNAINENESVPSGYHMLRDITTVKPAFLNQRLRRIGRIGAATFEELKVVYDYRCATCGDREGHFPRLNPQEVVRLQQGHMNPSQPLSLENTIPQCQYCNQTYQDNFTFDQNGRVTALHNPNFVLRSDPAIIDAIMRLIQANR